MKYLLPLFLIITSLSYSQSTYRFNYLIEYDFESIKDSTKNKTVIYLTNSLDNSYYLKITPADSSNFKLEFIKQDYIWTTFNLDKQEFYRSEFITINCDYNLVYRNNFKFRVKEYNFITLKDTLINEAHLKRYKLEYSGRRKRKKSFPIGTNIYIIKDSTEFHLPILTHSTAYEEWKKDGDIPKGIFQEKIFYDFENKLESTYKLKKVFLIKKRLIIPEDCLEEKN